MTAMTAQEYHDARESRRLTGDDDVKQQIIALRKQVRELRTELWHHIHATESEEFKRRQVKEMAEQTALQRFGTRAELTEITSRVKLYDAASDLDEKGVQLVAQMAYMTGWIPFIDFHAFIHKGKVCIMPDYKRLVQDSDPGNLSWSFRQMTAQERKERFVDAMPNAKRIVGMVCELVEISKAKELAAAGLAHLYKPVLGFATIDLDKDYTMNARDPLKRGEIRALRDALNQTAKGQQAQDHFRAQLREASKAASLPAPFVDPETGEDTVLLEEGEQSASSAVVIDGSFTDNDQEPVKPDPNDVDAFLGRDADGKPAVSESAPATREERSTTEDNAGADRQPEREGVPSDDAPLPWNLEKLRNTIKWMNKTGEKMGVKPAVGIHGARRVASALGVTSADKYEDLVDVLNAEAADMDSTESAARIKMYLTAKAKGAEKAAAGEGAK